MCKVQLIRSVLEAVDMHKYQNKSFGVMSIDFPKHLCYNKYTLTDSVSCQNMKTAAEQTCGGKHQILRIKDYQFIITH